MSTESARPNAETPTPGEKAAGTGLAPTDGPVPGDLRMAAALGPILLASAVGLLPFTVFSTFLVPISETAGSSVAAMGGLRGLGGLAALVVGVSLAPLIDRVPKTRAAAAALGLLGVSAAVGAVGEFFALAAFCLLVGAATAILNPALTASAADRYGDDAASGRAATLVTATQSMTAMLAAPLVALPAVLWGWRGDLVAVAVTAAALGVVFVLRKSEGEQSGQGAGTGPGYIASFLALARIPGAMPLILIGCLRTGAFMGYLSYLAAFYADRFQLTPGVFALVWTLSGASFFVGNLLAGRLANIARPRLRTERLLLLSLLAVLACISGFYFTGSLPLALSLTALLGAGHATVAACVVSLLVRCCGDLRGSALSINAAGMSLGVFAGAALGGVGLGLAGYAGTALVFAALTLAAVAAALVVSARSHPQSANGSPPADQ
ncbi:MAG: MFS transporter [Nocardiopsaceae bacterium]|nr:MFS transporter [Nocardiopsaceae bacterium]